MKKDVSQYINKSIFITATNTDVGKTYACEKFLKYFAKEGLKVGYFKPCETGVINFPIDGMKMLNLVKELNPSFEAEIFDVVPYQFKLPAAPYVAKENTIIDNTYEWCNKEIDSLMETRQILGELLARHTGKTLEEYFQFKRLSVAKTMLLKNGNTPALVARQLGYPNVQYFSLIFKKITGVSPNNYRHSQN
mgnify:CR=1 FL=1